MDPNTCLDRWIDAVKRDDLLEARYAAEDLARWIERGGFEPDWDANARAAFFVWRSTQGAQSRSTPDRLWLSWVRALSTTPPQREEALEIALELQRCRDTGQEPTNWTTEGRAEFDSYLRAVSRIDSHGKRVLASASERWHLDARDDLGADVLVKDENGLVVAWLCRGTDNEGDKSQLATARLVAAAPELLDFVDRVLSTWESLGGTDPDAECNGGDALDALADLASAARKLRKEVNDDET